jgi:hypothetical protein
MLDKKLLDGALERLEDEIRKELQKLAQKPPLDIGDLHDLLHYFEIRDYLRKDRSDISRP